MLTSLVPSRFLTLTAHLIITIVILLERVSTTAHTLWFFLLNFLFYRILFLATKCRSMSPRGLHWESIWHERFTVTLHFWLRRLRKPVLCIFLQTHDWSIGGFGINRNRISGFPLRNDHVYAHSRTTVYPLNIPFKL